MKALGCQGHDLLCAQTKTVDEIQDAQTEAMSQLLFSQPPSLNWIMRDAIYRPVTDGSFLPVDFAQLVQSGGQSNKKANILCGTTRDEYGMIILSYFPSPIPLPDAEKELATFLRDTNRTLHFIKENNRPAQYRLNSSDPDTVRNIFVKSATYFFFRCPLQFTSQVVVAQGGGPGQVFTYRMDSGRFVGEALGFGTLPFSQDRVCLGDDVIPSLVAGISPRESHKQEITLGLHAMSLIDSLSLQGPVARTQ